MNDEPDASPPLSAAAARMRRTRDRRRRGLIPIAILLHEGEVASLVRTHLLDPEATHDKIAIRKAMHDWLDSGVLR